MRSLKTTIYFSFILIILCITIPLGNARILVYHDTSLRDIIGILPIILIITIILEFSMFFVSLHILIKTGTLNRAELFKSVAIVNLFTFPITQFLAILIAILLAPYYILFYFLIELVPIFIEFALFLYIFNKLSGGIEIRNLISSKKIFVYTLTANLITFLVGLLLFLPTNFFSFLLS